MVMFDVLAMAGGPLYEGSIEECHGRTKLKCPWHRYSFDVQTGMTDFGLQVSQSIHFRSRQCTGLVTKLHIAYTCNKPKLDVFVLPYCMRT